MPFYLGNNRATVKKIKSEKRSTPCKIRTGILVGSSRDFSSWRESLRDPGKIHSRRAKSRRDRSSNLAKIQSRQDSSREAKIPAAKILPSFC